MRPPSPNEAEPVNPRRSPEPRPRRSGALLLAAALALAGLLWAGRAELGQHLAHWSGRNAHQTAVVDLTRLAPTLDASALARQLGQAALRCQPLDGGSVCDAAPARIGGLNAARLRATWQQGRLQTVDILLPWWRHHAAAGMLTQRLGPPSGHTVLAADGQREASLGWDLPQGTVRLARAPGWNPWRWSTVRWRAADAPTNAADPAEIRPAW